MKFLVLRFAKFLCENAIKKSLSALLKWYSQGDLNPCRIRERDVS